MCDVPQISEAEWEIMKIIWTNPNISAREVMKELEESIEWKINTVKTLLGRLVEKKAIGFEKNNRTYFYYPLVSKEECVKAESKSFLERVYNGSVGLMMANFLKHQKLSKKDIDQLKNILNEKDE